MILYTALTICLSLIFLGTTSASTLGNDALGGIPGPVTVHATDLNIGTSFNNSTLDASILNKRDFTCGPGSPCINGACCGPSGFCGYGTTYCGTGCQSNCDAHAECGQFASPAGKTCPLNVCCSQFGFCGTTEEFCEASRGCQSNCVTHPVPPADPQRGNGKQKMIGYYEAWMARSSCHKREVKDLPLEQLTHLNFAFAFLDPNTFDVITMDAETPESLFKDAAAAKTINPGIEVWLSIGGWTFSNDGTVTQPILGNIARSAENRSKFAKNLIRFMMAYGFDGIDIDWEYPGAPDRGGRPEDVLNFTLLMRDLKAAFAATGRRFGLSFTEPTSFWYMRWFDLPGLANSVDFINVMSYDLHGEWDRNNAIGNVVQAHTNITEIEWALELFWRNGVPPSKLNMGYGFYGRSFQLADASCTGPGCHFQGSALPGPCSKEAGILMYYEIMALKAQNPELPIVWDKAAAVKYLVYGGGKQWVSFDDADTFKQKREFQNKMGLGGALIWASDADDDKFTAMSGLIGAPVGSIQSPLAVSRFANTPANTAACLMSDSGKECFIDTAMNRCFPLDTTFRNHYCSRAGYVPVGLAHGVAAPHKFECPKSDKGQDQGLLICCPDSGATETCTWRQNKGRATEDCNGQCEAGEIRVGLGDHNGWNSWGGFPRADGNIKKCGRGGKAFCCASSSFATAVADCSFKKTCASGERSMTTKKGPWSPIAPVDHYCCKDPSIVHSCRWETGSGGRGGEDCVNANCKADEVELARDGLGENGKSCRSSRLQALCCKVAVIGSTPKEEGWCEDLCDLEADLCKTETTYRYVEEQGIIKRANTLSGLLAKRGERDVKLTDDLETTIKRILSAAIIRVLLRLYPSARDYFRSELRQAPLQGLLSMDNDWKRGARDVGISGCQNSALRFATRAEYDAMSSTTRNRIRPEVDHQIDAVIVFQGFLGYLFNGHLPSQAISRFASPITNDLFWRRLFSNTGLPESYASSNPVQVPQEGRVPGWEEFFSRDPLARLGEGIGSDTNPSTFVLIGASQNGIKGRLAHNNVPVALSTIQSSIRHASRGRQADPRHLGEAFTPLRDTDAMFNYVNDNRVVPRRNTVYQTIRAELILIGNHLIGADHDLHLRWDEFMHDIYTHMAVSARRWATNVLDSIEAALNSGSLQDTRGWSDIQIRDTIRSYRGRVNRWQFPIPPPPPPPLNPSSSSSSPSLAAPTGPS